MLSTRRTRRICVVTGAGSGIGRASVLRLAARGDLVAALDVDEAALEALGVECDRRGLAVESYVTDVRDRPRIQEVCSSLAARFGGINYAFSNAGVARRAPAAEMDTATWDTVVDIHVTGAFNVYQAVVPHMGGTREAALVLCASDYSIVGMAGNANYAAAKAALYSLAKALANETAGQNIRVNCVGPGPIDTPLLRVGRTSEEYSARQREMALALPMRRLGRPDEVASVVDFLLSERSAYITGQILQPNGGQVMW